MAREALERVGLKARMHHRPSELSGGEQQRAALARALINQPQALAGRRADGQSGQPHRNGNHEYGPSFNRDLGMTVVMVTHERALAERYAQRMIFLADGKLVDDRPILLRRSKPACREDAREDSRPHRTRTAQSAGIDCCGTR